MQTIESPKYKSMNASTSRSTKIFDLMRSKKTFDPSGTTYQTTEVNSSES